MGASGVMHDLTDAVDVGMGAVDASGVSMNEAATLADHYSERLLAVQPTVETEIIQPYMPESRQAIDALIGRYDATQPSVSTRIEQPNMPQARQQVQNYIGELGDIPNNVSTTITTHYLTTGTGAVLPVSPIGGTGGYAAGTPYVQQTGLAYLHQGEAVLPRSEAAEYRGGRGGGGTVVIAPIILERGQYTDANGELMFQQIAEMIQAQQGAF